MKTLAAVLIAMIITVTASAETWKQKVARLEREIRSLKTQVAALTKQIIKLQKENNAMMGDQEVPEKKEVKVLTKTEIRIKQVTAEIKLLRAKYERNYRFTTRANRSSKAKLVQRIKDLEQQLKQLKKNKELNKGQSSSKSGVPGWG
ncbi:MAG: hypothetical protein L3J71_03600 [Victivallaceae bacterium]|nr:hypothetical protein [Victivallaceae bacterium]